MKFPHKRLLLAAALGLPVMFTGCHSRAELLTSTSADSPNRSVIDDAEPDDERAAQDDAPQLAADSSLGKSTDESQSVSLPGPDVRAPHAILQSAGAVIEFDEQGRAVGVDLTEARITPEITRSVAELSELQWVDLRGTRATDADLAVICALPQFELIALGQTRITDAGLQHLNQQHRLRFLSLDGTAITDAGLSSLSGLPRLEGLSLVNTAVSKSAARDFEQRNPACRVILDDEAPETSSRQSAPQPRPDRQLQDTIDWTQETSQQRRPADTPTDTIDWSQPAPGTQSTPEPQQWPTTHRREAQPAPGEPTAGTDQAAKWFLDDTKPTVPAQPLPQSSVAQSTAEQPPVHQKMLPQAIEQAAPVQQPRAQQPPAQQRSVQLTPVQSATIKSSPRTAEETAQQLHQVLQQRLLDPEVLTVLSRHLLAREEHAKAARALEALASLQPDNPQVRFDLGVALARTGDYDQAHSHLACVVGDATAWYNLGVIAFERDEPQHSERYFGRAIDLAPDFSEARTWLARVRKSSSTGVSPTAQPPQQVDGQDLVDLLMSEFGSAAAGTSPAPNRSAAGITIVPKQ